MEEAENGSFGRENDILPLRQRDKSDLELNAKATGVINLGSRFQMRGGGGAAQITAARALQQPLNKAA